LYEIVTFGFNVEVMTVRSVGGEGNWAWAKPARTARTAMVDMVDAFRLKEDGLDMPELV